MENELTKFKIEGYVKSESKKAAGARETGARRASKSRLTRARGGKL